MQAPTVTSYTTNCDLTGLCRGRDHLAALRRESSPERSYYYHPSRHSAGQPIVAGWAFQWICQLSFDRDSWTASVDARRLHPLEGTDHTAALQVRALLGRLPGSEAVPLFVFDGGYDSAS